MGGDSDDLAVWFALALTEIGEIAKQVRHDLRARREIVPTPNAPGD